MYLRTVKVPSSNGTVNEYVRVVESSRQDGKFKQRVIADLGRRDVLTALRPQLQRPLSGQPRLVGETPADDLEVLEAATWGLCSSCARCLPSWGCGTASRSCSATPRKGRRSASAPSCSWPIA